MGQPHGDDVARDDSYDRGVPDHAGINDADVHGVQAGAEQVPAHAERVGREWDDVLPDQRKVGQVMGQVVSQRDGYQTQYKKTRHLPDRNSRPVGGRGTEVHQRAEQKVEQLERQQENGEGDGPDRSDGIAGNVLQGDDQGPHGLGIDHPSGQISPQRGGEQAVECHAGQHKQHEHHG